MVASISAGAGVGARVRVRALSQPGVEDVSRFVAPYLAYIIPGSPQPAEGSHPLSRPNKLGQRVTRPATKAPEDVTGPKDT